MAKRLNYGCIYGITEHGLSEQFSMPLEKTIIILEKFHQMYGNIYNFTEATNIEVFNNRQVRNYNGRILNCNFGDKRYLYEKACRRAVSWKIQSVSADITIWCTNILTLDNWNVILQIHDSIVNEEDESVVPDCMVAMRKVMKTKASEFFRIPLDVDFKIGDHL